MQNDVKVVILAAGKGTRMKNEKPKALVEIAGKPMLEHLGISAKEATGNAPIAVVGHGGEMVQTALGEKFIYVTQTEQLGTAHAVLSAKDACGDAKRIVVLYGDHPFVSSGTIKKLLEKSSESGAAITMATALVPNFENEYKVFANFAKILRDGGKIAGIRERKDASEEEKSIVEVNPGYYVFNAEFLWPNLEKIKNENAQGEYYLTDLLHLAAQNGNKIESIETTPREAMGANSKEELEILEKMAI